MAEQFGPVSVAVSDGVATVTVDKPPVNAMGREVKLGLIPGGGGTQRLPARIGTAAAKELLFLGSLIDAPRALALGLVNQVSEPGGALAEARPSPLASPPCRGWPSPARSAR